MKISITPFEKSMTLLANKKKDLSQPVLAWIGLLFYFAAVTAAFFHRPDGRRLGQFDRLQEVFLAAAGIAQQVRLDGLDRHAIYQLGNGLEVAVTAAGKADIGDDIALQVQRPRPWAHHALCADFKSYRTPDFLRRFANAFIIGLCARDVKRQIARLASRKRLMRG